MEKWYGCEKDLVTQKHYEIKYGCTHLRENMKTSINSTREKLSVELPIIFAAKSVISLNYNSELSGVLMF